MLNPIKSPQEMLYEQAGLPHFAGGKKVDVVTQFASRIQDAITKYTRATGKPPSAEEVRQLEEHIRGLSQPSTPIQQTQARLAQQTPGMSHLVDSSGRAYRPVLDPATGKLVTPERARGYDASKQFGSTPMNVRARQKAYDPNVGQQGYVFTPDEFTQVANTGRTSTRTNKRSHTPSSEELVAKQQAAEEIGHSPAESYNLEEGPRSAMDMIVGNADALEAQQLFNTRTDAMRALRPRPGDPRDPELMRDVERVRQSFLARGIEPDEEDIINGLHSLRNPGVIDPNSPNAPPIRHNYTGENPIAERPMIDPSSGKTSQEMLEWRDRMRASGQSERATVRSPSDWQPETRREYLLDTTPDTRQPFAQDWSLEDQVDRRRKQVQGKAEGGMMRSPRDMYAELLVNGYNKGGMTGPAMEMSHELDNASYNPLTATRAEDYANFTPAPPVMGEYHPRPKERVAALGQDLLEKAGIKRNSARRASQTMFGGHSSVIPEGFGLADIAAMTPAGFFATLPLNAGELGYSVGEAAGSNDYSGLGMEATAAALLGYPGYRAGKALYNKAKDAGKYVARNPNKTATALGAGAIAGLNAAPTQSRFNPMDLFKAPEYRSVLERN
jgi:hypothetical protein